MNDRSERRVVDAHIGPRWGERAVLLHIVGGDPVRAPLPPEMESDAVEGLPVSVLLDATGRLDGWVLPDERVGVRMDAELTRWGEAPATLSCQGPCRTLWYAVSGGGVSPDEGCLTCGAPVAAA